MKKVKKNLSSLSCIASSCFDITTSSRVTKGPYIREVIKQPEPQKRRGSRCVKKFQYIQEIIKDPE